MELSFESFRGRLADLNRRIAASCDEAVRLENSVRLLPVTKNHPVDAALYAWRAGLAAVGENRVQEALGKHLDVDSTLRWELIGPLQTNKVKKALEVFGRVQTVDRAKLVKVLQRNCEEAERILPILMQVNAGRDPNKAGVSLEDAGALADLVAASPNLKLEGLMTIAPLDDDVEVARRCFAALRRCRDDLEIRLGVELPELSMGMSGDLREAILEGSTMVRVGSALFGAR